MLLMAMRVLLTKQVRYIFRMFFDLRFRSLDEPFKNAYREANTINTAQSIEWIFSNEGKVMGRGIQTGISFNGKNFSVNYSVRI